ncbi:hypothetical protein M5X02_00700 [Paenibacillus alvei]|uniref:hypothetical protein n=1 Tax=Paenibacillus alvei TaxID=44250 RepID=UPI002283F429|nr:hypothetical protein [Paenibacillus alvei]MCY9539197.1 hypothetical protein [Paenibacillus alvei]
MGKETQLQEIWESWDYHLEEALKRADDITRRMFKEATQFNVPKSKQEKYFRQRFDELMTKIARQANGT